MIVVKVEIWPFGNEKKKRLLGTLKIVRIITGTPTIGNYKVELYSGKKCWKKGEVKGYKRKSQSFWHLIHEAFKCLFGT